MAVNLLNFLELVSQFEIDPLKNIANHIHHTQSLVTRVGSGETAICVPAVYVAN